MPALCLLTSKATMCLPMSNLSWPIMAIQVRKRPQRPAGDVWASPQLLACQGGGSIEVPGGRAEGSSQGKPRPLSPGDARGPGLPLFCQGSASQKKHMSWDRRGGQAWAPWHIGCGRKMNSWASWTQGATQFVAGAHPGFGIRQTWIWILAWPLGQSHEPLGKNFNLLKLSSGKWAYWWVLSRLEIMYVGIWHRVNTS